MRSRGLAEGRQRREPALLHRGRGEAREADHVARREDVRLRGAEVRRRRRCARARRPRGRRRRGSARRSRPGGRRRRATTSDGMRLPLARRVTAPPPSSRAHRLDLLAEAEDEAEAAQVVLQRLDDLVVDEVEDARPLARRRVTRDAERGGHRGVLEADHAGADDGQRARERGRARACRRSRARVRPSKSTPAGRAGARADGDHDPLGVQRCASPSPSRSRACAGRRRRRCRAKTSTPLRRSWSAITSCSCSITCCVRQSRSSIVMSACTR